MKDIESGQGCEPMKGPREKRRREEKEMEIYIVNLHVEDGK